MLLEIQRLVRSKFIATVKDLFGFEIDNPTLGFPPTPEMGEISITACFDLAKHLKRPPRQIAQQIAGRLLPLEGVERISIAGAGYINLHLDRAVLASALFRSRAIAQPSSASAESISKGKILVEHTSINPNKAAHIGHLRNAVLGDTLARLLRYQGHEVEVENYIDNTGVQVADVVNSFAHFEKKMVAQVREMAASSEPRFDYLCWDLYARVFQRYEDDPSMLALRKETLKAIEEGHGELAEMASVVSTAISRLHLDTMRRINIRYDLLVEESEILRLEFWKYAFELMKKTGAVRFEDSGKNQGCWVMSLEDGDSLQTADGGEEDVKIIVRSNGTVTYVGKDIAYHLWKFNLLGRDFQYQRFYRYPDGREAWRTSVQEESGAPQFGRGSAAYAVIDTRQSYLQDVVRRAFLSLGYKDQAAHLHHFAYEVVGLSLRCARDMGLEAGEDRKNYVEVSGRKGLGIKADDLIDRLVAEALKEVRAREMTTDFAAQENIAQMIAVSALRYFLLKYTRRTIIAFDLEDALAFEGETGPYLQYTVVRARNILRKYAEARPGFDPWSLLDELSPDQLRGLLSEKDAPDFWEMVLLAAGLEAAVEQAVLAEEPATLAKYAFRLAQAFNNFYHQHHILHETDALRQMFLLFLVSLASQSLAQTLELLGIEIPERM
ncbi:MAG TPA: arginine--tRNA ligase [Terriglobia bacterium]|nr:arginine--tRNA ligase [Terriglobia bacterium]